MKYTTSVDGVKRCSVFLQMRFTRSEYQDLSKRAKRHGYKSVEDMLDTLLLDRSRLHVLLDDEEEYL
jgi:hypothetical protein